MEISVFNIEGKDTGKKVQLDDAIFAVEPKDHAMYLDVKRILADRRQGTAKSKERSEMSGSTRKIKKQKGTGGARSGDINSPVMVGGARCFGPRPRDYSFKLNKKVIALARKSALTYKAKDAQIIVLENFTFDTPKTKQIVDLKNKLKISDKKSLLVLQNENKNIYLSSRNLDRSEVTTANKLNTYDILNAQSLVLTEGAVEVLNTIFNK
ncbi:MAG: 50S ribosomal protein L4 [Bacteroidales bacterium]|jgi:large subunit ribosomal protein L4|nr:50S ribosomal protein L4 [Bacteroidales bacterium]MDD6002689.1 50S ribosomal protein L4 [Bacteroidales bacterium]